MATKDPNPVTLNSIMFIHSTTPDTIFTANHIRVVFLTQGFPCKNKTIRGNERIAITIDVECYKIR
jgi:hypothetical protein